MFILLPEYFVEVAEMEHASVNNFGSISHEVPSRFRLESRDGGYSGCILYLAIPEMFGYCVLGVWKSKIGPKSNFIRLCGSLDAPRCRTSEPF